MTKKCIFKKKEIGSCVQPYTKVRFLFFRMLMCGFVLLPKSQRELEPIFCLTTFNRRMVLKELGEDEPGLTQSSSDLGRSAPEALHSSGDEESPIASSSAALSFSSVVFLLPCGGMPIELWIPQLWERPPFWSS
ncbi:hypothetical protein GBA52_015323 [Prunus armeniaca]|nr:hypothetical protein GBA52_015323 [Prunus armeniaca]